MDNLAVRAKSPAMYQMEQQKANNDLLHIWFRTLPRSADAKPLTRPRLKTFFQTSERLILQQDASTTHQVIEKLASEGGLARIAELTQLDVGNMEEKDRVQTLTSLHLPFLNTITLRDVLSSLMLEKSVGDIYVFLFGIAGRRALALFNSLAIVLQTQLNAVPEVSLVTEASIILTSLLQILQCNQTPSLLAGFRTIVDVAQSCLDAQKLSSKDTLQSQTATQNMAKIRRYLDHGSNLPLVQTPAMVHAKGRADFELARDMPGTLSPSGPRHDNDHADIENIKIMPTAQEIRSDRAEYLPVKDPSMWHIQGMSGLLDQQFRLLREDSVGLLRDSVRMVIEELTSLEPGSKPTKDDRGLRVYRYYNLTFSDVFYDKRK